MANSFLLGGSMFRRLFLAFAFLIVLVLGSLGLAVRLFVTASDERSRVFVLVLAALAVGILLAGVFAWTLSAAMGQPLRALKRAVELMGAGNVELRVFPTYGDEVCDLSQAFNTASEQLGARIGALEADRQQLRTILSGMVEGVVALDADQRVLFANQRAGELLEFSGPNSVGRPVWEVVRHRPLLDAVKRALDRPEPFREEFNWNGAHTRSLTVHAARLPGNPARGAVLVVHDTSELRRLERLRQDFVANVSHELKTPLSVIKVCVETLLDGAMDDAHHRDRFLEQIARQTDRLHALILDLLSLAQIESGTEMFDFRDVAVDAVVRTAVDRHRPRAEARRQEIVIEEAATPVHVWADEEAVDQILENLLDNALKYTPEGGLVRIRLANGDGQGRIEVVDTGIGIPAADLPRIFERFYRVDKARSREMGGTGLGLAIVKHLVQAMHGSVRATSQVGAGTTFTISLPLAHV